MASAEQSVVKTLSNSHIRVLAMKLQVPYLPLDYIKRPKLLSRLCEPAQVRLLTAAAGYGKSSAMTEWVNLERHQKGTPVAWLTLDPKENDPSRFLLYLISAVNAVLPKVGSELLEEISKWKDLDSVFLRWMDELTQLGKPDQIKTELILALDDCHHLTNDHVRSMLDQLLNYLPEHVSLICSSRMDWHSQYAQLQAKGALIKVDEKELSLSKEETANWLNVHGVSELQTNQLDEVHQLTDGWLTGLQLLHSCVSNCDPSLLKADEPLLQSYFNEVLTSEISEGGRYIYRCLAMLGIASASYLQAVFGIESADKELSVLMKHHCFMLRDPLRPSWMRLHPMLQQLLLSQVDVIKLRGAQLQASGWLAAQGETVLAVGLALKSGNKHKAAELVEQTAEAILAEQDIAQLLSWKAQLPTDVITASPRLIIIFSWTLAFAQQLDEAERLMAQIDQFLPLSSTERNDEVSGQLFAVRAYIARVRGKIENSIQLCQQALEKLPKENYVARAVTYFNLANAYMTLDNLPKAREYNRSSYETARAAGSVHLEMLALHEHARIEQIKGNLLVAAKLVDEGLRLEESLTNSDSAAAYGRLLIYRGYLSWLGQDVNQAEVFLRQGMQVAIKSHDAYVTMGYVLLSNMERQRNNVEGAFDYLNQAEAQLQRWRVPSFVFQPWLTTMQSNLLIDQGKAANALASLEQLYGQAKATPYLLAPEHYPHLKGLVDIFYVRAKAFLGEHKEALKLLDHSQQDSDETQQGFRMIFVYLMRALLRFQLGQEDEALKDFRLALSKAEKENCVYPFIEYSSGMASLYQKLPQHLMQGKFIERVLQHVDITQDEGPNRAFAQVKSVISQRELGVLKLIAQGHSNQEIADKLFISLHTVKTHARRINSKLGVKSRTQAIIKAKEIGLI